MLNHETVNRLRYMKLTGMADSLKEQDDDSAFQEMGFYDRLGLMVDREFNKRQHSRLQRLVSRARFQNTTACVEDIRYDDDRRLDRGFIMELASCNYIPHARNVLVIGPTGAGKSFLAQALGQAACRHMLTTRYVQLPDLLDELKIAKRRDLEAFNRLRKQIVKFDLLIIDEWLLFPISEEDSEIRVKLISGVWTLKNKWRILPIGLAGSQSTLEGYAMKKCTASSSSGPEATVPDPLTELLRRGARDLIAKAVEAELEALLEDCSSLRLEDGRAAVVRNGYLPGRAVQTGIGDVEVRVPKVRDRSGSGIVFNSSLLPPYLKRAKNVEEFLPWLYLKGVSTGGYGEALHSLLGENAKGLSANTISRLKEKWTEEHQEWNRRDLSGKKYVYWWADGVYSRVRMDDKLCLLVIIGTTEKGEKELVAVEDGYRESEASWHEVLSGLRSRGLKDGPKLAVGDGSLGFWNALRKEYPECVHQRCWVHKTANVLNKVPKSLQGKMKADLHEIWMAETKEEAGKAFDRATAKYGAKYPKAIDCLTKDREELLAFYNFPAVHWVHIRTSNPVESAFSTIRLRTAKTRNCGSRATTLAMVFKLAQSAEKRWRKLKGYELLGEVITGVIFKDGIRVSDQSDRSAA